MLQLIKQYNSDITMNTSAIESFNCTAKNYKSEFLTGYNVFVWILSGLIILANVLLIIVILNSTDLRSQVFLLSII